MKYLNNIFFTIFVLILCSLCTTPLKATDPLPSWNEGVAKQTIVNFIRTTTDKANPCYIPPEERLATFDQDGTLWVEQPIYTQVIYCLDRVPLIVEAKPELKYVEPFKTVLSGNREAILNLSIPDLEKINDICLKNLHFFSK